MKILKMLLAIFLLAVFQSVVISKTAVFGFYPDLLIAFLAIITFSLGYRESFWYALVIGFVLDVLSHENITFLIILPLSTFFLGFLKEKIFGENDIVLYLFVFMFIFVIYYFMMLQNSTHYLNALSISIIISALSLFFVPYLSTIFEKVALSDETTKLRF